MPEVTAPSSFSLRRAANPDVEQELKNLLDARAAVGPLSKDEEHAALVIGAACGDRWASPALLEGRVNPRLLPTIALWAFQAELYGAPICSPEEGVMRAFAIVADQETSELAERGQNQLRTVLSFVFSATPGRRDSVVSEMLKRAPACARFG